MINHVRTLLLNSRQDTISPAPWDRYIPEDFQPLVLSDYLESIRKTLVGVDGWWDRTYRVEALLNAVYSSRYDDKHDWLDARTTQPKTVPFLYIEPEFTVTRVAAPGSDAFVAYITKPYDKLVPVKRNWRVMSGGGDLFTVAYGSDNNRKSVRAYISPANNGWILPLDVDVDLLFSGFGANTDVWQVTSYKKPKNVFSFYPPIVKALPVNWTAPLFTVAEPSDEPLAEYKRWYQTCVNPEDLVVGVVLAYTLQASKLLL
jgi:hypothetical protein